MEDDFPVDHLCSLNVDLVLRVSLGFVEFDESVVEEHLLDVLVLGIQVSVGPSVVGASSAIPLASSRVVPSPVVIVIMVSLFSLVSPVSSSSSCELDY